MKKFYNLEACYLCISALIAEVILYSSGSNPPRTWPRRWYRCLSSAVNSCPSKNTTTLLICFLCISALIAEVILYSEGFESSKNLAQKMVQMYKLCSEQLSQQDHYDFGMRAVKSVLVMAGALKRQNPDKNEDVVLIRALRDSNLPKFLSQDAILFQVGMVVVHKMGLK